MGDRLIQSVCKPITRCYFIKLYVTVTFFKSIRLPVFKLCVFRHVILSSLHVHSEMYFTSVHILYEIITWGKLGLLLKGQSTLICNLIHENLQFVLWCCIRKRKERSYKFDMWNMIRAIILPIINRSWNFVQWNIFCFSFVSYLTIVFWLGLKYVYFDSLDWFICHLQEILWNSRFFSSATQKVKYVMIWLNNCLHKCDTIWENLPYGAQWFLQISQNCL